MTIGVSPSPREIGVDYAFAGVIDQVRVSNAIRYTTDFVIPKRLKTDDSTLALFHFDEGQGATLRDASGNDHHGTIKGAEWVDDTAIRRHAALGLAEFGVRGVPMLAAALTHQDPSVQVQAASALSNMGSQAGPAVPALKTLSHSQHERVRIAATQALSQIQRKTTWESILGLFGR